MRLVKSCSIGHDDTAEVSMIRRIRTDVVTMRRRCTADPAAQTAGGLATGALRSARVRDAASVYLARSA